MSNLMVERVEVMVGRAAERVERVPGKERVGIGVAAMVKGRRVGVINCAISFGIFEQPCMYC